MGRKAKRCAANKVAVPPPVAQGSSSSSSSSSDGEAGGSGGPTGLPRANLVRLMRQVVPSSIMISAHAKDLTHDCALEFVGFVAGEASAQAEAQHRRIMAPEHFVSSFQTLGFDGYVQPMTTYMHRFREQDVGGSGSGSGSGFARHPPPPPPAATTTVAPGGGVSDEDDEEGSTSPDNM